MTTARKDWKLVEKELLARKLTASSARLLVFKVLQSDMDLKCKDFAVSAIFYLC